MLIEGNRQVKVRLAEIDTPESNQPYGTRSKQTFTKLVSGKNILVKVQKARLPRSRRKKVLPVPVKQMSSCEEGYFYLEKCGLKRLDCDKDRIPCQTLCR